ncbi:TolB family protein [Lusitaniella coriacea LEGE 07157]|uniref:TolB family protein n=1 Tax=Lusitaniella coriacea LEGE 07157 TaxID=945747 RepID=A0A8J7ARR2_9CYAN|nr:PD40 domain-containing protein [Lusitaniella coriacea]MBE9114956.1 TolB family protein [Lusitaniella coriacea LEGE 07157]
MIGSKHWVLLLLTAVLSGCGGYPRLLNFSFDAGGRGLNSPASELSPQIASRYIAFVSDRNGSQDVYLFDAENRKLIDVPGLNSLDAIASNPAISQDGRYIVYSNSRQGNSEIELYDRETQIARTLTGRIQAEVRHPTISAEGSAIAFEVATDGQWDIMVVDRSGNALDIPGMPKE